MAEHDQPPEPVPAPPQQPAGRSRGLPEATGFLAGRTALGLTRLALKNKTIRVTLRNARDANRDPE